MSKDNVLTKAKARIFNTDFQGRQKGKCNNLSHPIRFCDILNYV